MTWPYRMRASIELQGNSESNERVWFASADMQGWRRTMEDRHKTILNFGRNGSPKADYFALFDGHGGSNAVRHAVWHLDETLFAQETYLKQQYLEALRVALITIDKEICSNPVNLSGSTALVTLVVDDAVHIANIGDSRAVICTAGRAQDLTRAHTTSLKEESARILKAGGSIEDGRVCGRLAMTRSLGDARFKKKEGLPPEEQLVICNPDTITYQVQSEDEFMVLASDGIWDCFSSQDVIDIIRYQISLGATLTQASAFLCNACVAPEPAFPPGIDNMTIIVVAFLQGQTKTEWMEWIAKRVKTKVGRATPSTIPQIHAQYKPLKHPAHITTDFDFMLSPPAEPLLLIPAFNVSLRY